MYRCFPPPPAELEPVVQVEKPAQRDDLTTDDGLQIGSGFRPLDSAGNRVTPACFGFDRYDPAAVSLDADIAAEATAYTSRSQQTFVRYSRNFVQGDVDFSKVQADATAETSGYFQSNYEEALFTLAIRVTTSKRVLGSDLEPGRACETQPRMCDFYASCGSHYVKEEHLGGYLYLSIGTHSLSQQTINTLETEMGVSAAGVVDAKVALERVEQIVQGEQSAYLSLSSHGLTPPSNLDPTDPPEAYIRDILDYLDILECGANKKCQHDVDSSSAWGYKEALAAFTAGHSDASAYHPALGAVYNRVFIDYQPTFFQTCTGEQRGQDWTCYDDFAETSSGLRRQYRNADSASGNWKLRIASGRTKDSEKLRAAAFCESLLSFTDGTGALQYAGASTANSTSNPTVTVGPDTEQAALNGIDGAMSGGAEQTFIQPIGG